VQHVPAIAADEDTIEIVEDSIEEVRREIARLVIMDPKIVQRMKNLHALERSLHILQGADPGQPSSFTLSLRPADQEGAHPQAVDAETRNAGLFMDRADYDSGGGGGGYSGFVGGQADAGTAGSREKPESSGGWPKITFDGEVNLSPTFKWHLQFGPPESSQKKPDTPKPKPKPQGGKK